MDTFSRVKDLFNESIKTLDDSRDLISIPIINAANAITDALLQEKKVLTCGNGESASLSLQFSSHMLNRFQIERPGLPCISLSADTSTITSIANDSQFAEIFSKQIRAIGHKGDVLLTISNQLEPHNIIHAIDAAHDREMTVIALTGHEGGQLSDLFEKKDIEIRVPSWSTARIHETHLLVIHLICELIDQNLLGNEE
jgi:D-sedoheptulose 7-phosphate isomerase